MSAHSETPKRAPKKLTAQDVIDLLTGDVPSDQVADEARKEGISFQVTGAVEKQIRDAGGTDDLIRVLRSLAPRAPAVPPATPASHPLPPASPPVLMIESNPGQSQVYVDDEPVGTTSQQGRLKLTRLAAGEHRVRISLSGYQDREQTVTLTAGEVATVAATLQQAVAPAAPEVNPQPLPPQPEQNPPASPGQPGYLGVQAMQQQPAGARGVVISGAMPGGPADQAGLKPYNTILAINGQTVTTPQQLREAVASHQAGETVQVTWYNGSSNVTRQIRLMAAPAGAQTGQQQIPGPPSLKDIPQNGFAVFYVAHDHGQSGKDYCVGAMSIGNGMVYYKSTNGMHTFEIPLHSIREARRNTVYLVGYGAFHIRLAKGTNYNFVALDQQGHFQPPDPVITAIENAMGK